MPKLVLTNEPLVRPTYYFEHKIYMYMWESGQLTVKEYFEPTFDHVHDFLLNFKPQSATVYNIKVHDMDDVIVHYCHFEHDVNAHDYDTYA